MRSGRRSPDFRLAFSGCRRLSVSLSFAVITAFFKRRWTLVLALGASLWIFFYLGNTARFHNRWRTLTPATHHDQVAELLGRPDTVGKADVLGKERSDVLWLYWRGFWVYVVEFNSDTNNKPTAVYETWVDRRWDQAWFPPRKPKPL